MGARLIEPKAQISPFALGLATMSDERLFRVGNVQSPFTCGCLAHPLRNIPRGTIRCSFYRIISEMRVAFGS